MGCVQMTDSSIFKMQEDVRPVKAETPAQRAVEEIKKKRSLSRRRRHGKKVAEIRIDSRSGGLQVAVGSNCPK